jgi:hypothetical protein
MGVPEALLAKVLANERCPAIHPQGARHPRYNKAVRNLLDNLRSRALTDEQAAAEVQKIADRLRPGLDRLKQSGKPLK